jgi:hypothetical protein
MLCLTRLIRLGRLAADRGSIEREGPMLTAGAVALGTRRARSPTARPHAVGGGFGWYDAQRSVAIIQRSEYSMTAYSMSYEQFLERLR